MVKTNGGLSKKVLEIIIPQMLTNWRQVYNDGETSLGC